MFSRTQQILGLDGSTPMVAVWKVAVTRTPLWIDWSSGDGMIPAFRTRVLGAVGAGNIIIFSSTNLVDWEQFSIRSPSVEPVEFADPGDPGAPARFFRALEEESP